jgi:hypothetical protein
MVMVLKSRIDYILFFSLGLSAMGHGKLARGFGFLPLLSTVVAFNYTTCPAYWELQSQQVKDSFELSKFSGR